MYYYGTTWNNKGLLKATTNLTVAFPKQAYFGVQNIAAIFDDSLTRITNFSYTANPSSTMRVYGYRQNATGKTVVTVWFSPSGLPTDVNNFSAVNFTFTPADFTDPVWVDLRTGEVRAIPAANWSQAGGTCSFTNIPVYDSPILIAERSTIPIATPKQAWKRAHFSVPEQYDSSVSGDEADPDADGVSNFREYLASTDPRVSDNTGLPHAEIRNDHLTLRYNWNTAATDYAAMVAGSADLATWDTNTSVVEQTIVTNTGPMQTRDARLVAPISTAPKGFLHLYAVPQTNSP
jgi:hypothetical protein